MKMMNLSRVLHTYFFTTCGSHASWSVCTHLAASPTAH